MGHRVGLLAQFEQAAGNASGDIEERQVTDLARGVAQALGHLGAQGVEDFRVLAREFAKLVVADFGDFTLGLGANPGAALLFAFAGLEESEFAEEITIVEVGNDHLVAFVVLDQDGHRTLDDE
ncbi:hypothetical protein D3C71_1610650 [compost metagenome]